MARKYTMRSKEEKQAKRIKMRSAYEQVPYGRTAVLYSRMKWATTCRPTRFIIIINVLWNPLAFQTQDFMTFVIVMLWRLYKQEMTLRLYKETWAMPLLLLPSTCTPM